MAPEVASNDGGYSLPADIWSFGICLYHLAHGQIPHQNLSPMEAMIAIIQRDAPRCTAKRNISKPLKEVIEACLQKDPTARPTTQMLLQMKFW